MHPRVAQEDVGRRVAEHPGQRRVGQRGLAELGLVPPQVRPEGAIEAKHGAGGEAPLPEGMTVNQGRAEESPPAGGAMRGQATGIEVGISRGQVGTGGRVPGHRPRFEAGGRRLKFNLAAAPPRAHNGGLQNADTASINEVQGWRRALLWVLATILRLWTRTLRFEMDAPTRALLAKRDEPLGLVLWHNRLFISAEYFRQFRGHRPVAGLVSASKDGAWLAAFYRLVGIEPVRGSSSNHGREAARVLIERMRAGCDLGITPDGPRGPMYTVEPGVLIVTRRVNAPLLLLGVEYTRAWRLRSWDRFNIPWPFSRVRWRATLLPAQAADGSKLDAPAVRAALLAINPDLPD